MVYMACDYPSWLLYCTPSRGSSQQQTVVPPSPPRSLYRVFCMPSSSEFGKDWYLSRKIALLWWVEPSHFDIVLDYNSLEVTHKVEQAKSGWYGGRQHFNCHMPACCQWSCCVCYCEHACFVSRSFRNACCITCTVIWLYGSWRTWPNVGLVLSESGWGRFFFPFFQSWNTWTPSELQWTSWAASARLVTTSSLPWRCSTHQQCH